MGPSVMLAALLLTTQAPVASLGGLVSDAGTGAPIAGVVISISHPGRTGVSDSVGSYRLLNVPPGWHQLTARLIGYRFRAELEHAFLSQIAYCRALLPDDPVVRGGG